MPHNLLRRLSIVGFATVSLGTACLAVPSSVRAGPEKCPNGNWDPKTDTPGAIINMK